MKKNLLLVAFTFIIFGMKAQVAVYQYQSGGLTEESIKQVLKEYKKKGLNADEINKADLALHKRLQQQKNGTVPVLQKGNNPPPHVNTTSCVNPGFENGTNSDWNFHSGSVSSLSGVTLPCNSCASAPGAINNVVNSTSTISGQCTSGTDFYGGFPVVSPTGGSYSLLLNDASSNSKIEKASYTFLVTSTNSLFTFQFAAVLQSGGHLPSEQPYFHSDVTDSVTGAVIHCSQYDASAPASGAAAGWSVSNLDPNVSYKPWTTVTLNLQGSIGHVVTVSFIVSDCIYGGHFGYCYIDANCGNPANSISIAGFCGTTTGTVTMVAPPGYASYQWYGPNPPYTNAITTGGGNTATLTTSAAIGDTFLVNATTQTAGCVIPYKVVVKSGGIVLNTSSTSSCKGGSQGSVSAVVTGSGGNFNYAWTNSSGTAIGTSTTVASLPAGTYSVHVTDASNSCPPKDTTIKIASINPPLQHTVAVLCGSKTSLTAGAGSNYTWYDTTNVHTSVTTQVYNVAHGTNGQHYTTTYINSSTGCLDSILITLNQVNINFAVVPSPPCGGVNNGSLTFNASSNNSFSTYDWGITGGTTNGALNVPSPISINSLAGGSYTVVITAPSNTTCAYTYTGTLTQGIVPVGTPDVIKICNMDVLSLNPNVPGNVTHSWSGTGLPYIAGSPRTGAPYQVQPPFTNTTAGFYNYTDSIRTVPDGCLSIYNAVVQLKSFKTTTTILEKIKCYNGSTGKVKINVSEPNGPVNNPDKYVFTWSPGTYTSTTIGIPAFSTESNLNAGTYTCVVSNGNCVNTNTITLLNVAALRPDSFFGYYCPKDSLAILVADTAGNANYQWYSKNPNTLVINGANDSLHVLTQNVNNYYVTYKHLGCADSAVTMIPVATYNAFRPDETVNVFTPNNDKKNDVFFPFYQANLNQSQIARQAQDYTLKVYNRWGILMYETTDYNKGWDGKTKGGSDAEDGSYFFVVTYQSNCGTKADIVEKKGFIELLR